MSLIDAAIARSRMVLAMLALLFVAGWLSYVNVPKEAAPDVNIPIIYVSMTYRGISPEDAERLLVRPMEKELRSVEGAKEMRATAHQGGAYVLLEFEAGFDAQKALDDVRDKVDIAKSELPARTDEPLVHEVNFSLFPVLVVTLGGDVPERTLLRLARDLKEKVEALPNVLEAKVGGDREEQVDIVIDPLLLESYGLDARQIIDFVGRSNQLIAAGSLDSGSGRFAIKVPGLLETGRDILDLPIKVSGDAVVRVRDIASVRRTYKDRTTYARLDGKPAITLEVSKRTGRNVIETTESVRALVEAERQAWPDNVSVSFTQDKSNDIRTMLGDLQNNVLSAVLLVMIVVVAALGIRSGLLVGIAIPGSFLAGILVLATMGFTINIVVLFALILAVGMLVDGAIIVVEYADRKMAEGEPPARAYALAARRMAWPIASSTLTTIAAFLPLLFWPGVVGQFMKYLPLTLIATLAASLLMALIFVPTLGAKIGRAGAVDAKSLRALSAAEGGDLRSLRGFTGAYVRLLTGALRRPGAVVLAAVAVLIGSWMLYATFGKGVEFFPKVEPEQAILQVHARGNLSIDERDALVREVEAHALAVQRERGEFRAIYALSGEQQRRDETAGDIIGTIQLEFTDWDRRRKADEILADIRGRAAGLAGIAVETRKEEAGPPVGKPIQVRLSAREPALLDPAVARIRGFFDGLPGLKDVEDTRPLPGIEWEIAVDRAQAAKFGADILAIGNAVKLVTNGLEISEFRPNDATDEVDIVVRFPEGARTIDQLDQIRVQTSMGLVPIGNFVTRTAKPKMGELQRVGAKRTMSVKADVMPGVLADTKVKEIQAWLETAGIDPRIAITFKGEDEEQRKAQAFLSRAFLLALFLIAVILVAQFNSFYAMALVLSAIVMSTVGVMLGLLLIGQPFGIVMSGIGVIALAGVVVNNNIVLIDTFQRLRREIVDPVEAIVRTGAQRLRPVLLTTGTTILGVVPMMFALNIDFVTRNVSVGAPSTQWWTQISTAIACGLTFATVLTLVITPSALMLQVRAARWWAGRRSRDDEAAAATAPAE
ncbi:MAG: efflux RND transporter permease subunit [Rhodospirillaceae bacterium]